MILDSQRFNNCWKQLECDANAFSYVIQPIKIYLQNYKLDEIPEVLPAPKMIWGQKPGLWKDKRKIKGCEGGQSDNYISVGGKKHQRKNVLPWENNSGGTKSPPPECIVPVIQNKNNFSTFKGELIVLDSFKVIQSSHLPQALRVLWDFCRWVQGFGFHLLLFLLLQRQFDSCSWGREKRTSLCALSL